MSTSRTDRFTLRTVDHSAASPRVSAAESEAAPKRTSTRAASKAKGRVALLVEDDPHAADLARLLLEAEGFSVLRASSAEEALEMAPQQALDLITLDILLPRINGWEFLAKISQDATLRRVPVVIISGVSEGHLVALAGGAAAILQKPISRTELKRLLLHLGLPPARGITRAVLVVDDDPRGVELIAKFLPTPEYATVRAYGGREAIILARRVKPDLILLDLMMPEVSGFDVVQALQSDPGTAGIPIVVITAKEVTLQDRQILNSGPGKVLEIIGKVGLDFGRTDFVTEVRRALPQLQEQQPESVVGSQSARTT